MANQRCPLASASCYAVATVSHGRGLPGSQLGNVTYLRPARPLNWVGTDKVNRPSLHWMTFGAPFLWMRTRFMPVLLRAWALGFQA